MYDNKYGVKTQDNPVNKEGVPQQSESNKQEDNKETMKPSEKKTQKKKLNS